MKVVFKESNPTLGLKVQVATAAVSEGKYLMILWDTDADELIGTKWFTSLHMATEYAIRCVNGSGFRKLYKK